MIWSSRGFLLVILFLLVSCRQEEPAVQTTPTPFASTRPLPRILAAEPIPISLTNLAANPEFFEGSTLQLSGEYQKLPKLACHRDPHPSPATWGIVGEGLLANASGQDELLRSLLADNQSVTVEGRWLRYVGPIGCGKSAPVQEIWYLSLDRIIEPHPLARAIVESPISEGEPTTIASLPEPTTDPAQDEEESPTDFPAEQGTPTLAPTTPLVIPTNTTEPNPSPTLANGEAVSPQPTTGGTTTPEILETSTPTSSNTITATMTLTTPQNGTGTPGPTATSTPASQGHDFNNKGSIDFEDLRIGTLQSGIPDRWTIAVNPSDSITITVAPASTANIIISLINEIDEIIVDAQNQSGGGEVETIRSLSLTTPGLYEIYVDTEPAENSDYALMVMNNDSYSFSFQGTLVPSSPRNSSLAPENDHFWFFPLSDGDIFDLRVTPNSQKDPYLELYDPQGTRILTIDNGAGGETELLEDYEALMDGMYGIRVGEFDFSDMSYQILLTHS